MKTDGVVKLAQPEQAVPLDVCFLIGSDPAAWVQGHDGAWQSNPSREKQPVATSFSKFFFLGSPLSRDNICQCSLLYLLEYPVQVSLP